MSDINVKRVYRDAIGQKLEVGSYVTYPVRNGSSLTLTIGQIESIDDIIFDEGSHYGYLHKDRNKESWDRASFACPTSKNAVGRWERDYSLAFVVNVRRLRDWYSGWINGKVVRITEVERLIKLPNEAVELARPQGA